MTKINFHKKIDVISNISKHQQKQNSTKNPFKLFLIYFNIQYTKAFFEDF